MATNIEYTDDESESDFIEESEVSNDSKIIDDSFKNLIDSISPELNSSKKELSESIQSVNESVITSKKMQMRRALTDSEESSEEERLSLTIETSNASIGKINFEDEDEVIDETGSNLENKDTNSLIKINESTDNSTNLIDDSFGCETNETTIPAKIYSDFANNANINSTTIFQSKANIPSESKMHGKLITFPLKKADIPRRVLTPTILLDSSDDDCIETTSVENFIDIPLKVGFNSNKTIRQSTLDNHVVRIAKEEPAEKILVSFQEFRVQTESIKNLESDFLKLQNTLKTVKLTSLPDNGQLLLQRQKNLQIQLDSERLKLGNMFVDESKSIATTSTTTNSRFPAWDDIQAHASAVQPKTFGKQAMSTYNAQKAVTLEKLQQLHKSLQNCPKDSDEAEDPKGLNILLMPHQKQALAWLTYRETQKPSGGILADDMGLGKTLTMISLMLKSNENENDESADEDEDDERPERDNYKYNGGTLVVCPASLLNQWSGELASRTRRGLASCEIYHGVKRETRAKKLADHDMVVTTYSIVNNESERKGAIFRVKWRRIVLDEAHQIRNFKSQTSIACCKLAAKSRWALTGTPIQNKELDMYALLKFLRCVPFDDLAVWKRWVGDRSTGGPERLHTVISSLMLRRTKAELMQKSSIIGMPERKWELLPVELPKSEMDIYQRILIFSRTLFSQFLHQKAEKNQDMVDLRVNKENMAPNQEYLKVRQQLLKLNRVRDIKQHEILVLLLRLRQICCHPMLIKKMLDDVDDLEDGIEGTEVKEEMDLLDQLNKLNLNEDSNKNDNNSNSEEFQVEEGLGLKEAARELLNPSNKEFTEGHKSSKIEVLLNLLNERVIPKNDKAIIVSQWPTFLRIIGLHLKEASINSDQLDGSVPVSKRMSMVNNFNDPNHKMKVLLLSLTAGGVGLNLVGANHLFLLDLHWNPQLENQAQDRIYRMGQKKPVFVYKFMASATIEERIKGLQEKKLDLANSMLTGSKQAMNTKLSIQDLKHLFEM